MSDSRVDKVITGGDDTFVGYDGDEIDGIISGFEAAGLVVIDPDATVTRALLRDRLEDAFGSFLAHSPAKPDVFWPIAVTAVLDVLRDAR